MRGAQTMKAAMEWARELSQRMRDGNEWCELDLRAVADLVDSVRGEMLTGLMEALHAKGQGIRELLDAVHESQQGPMSWLGWAFFRTASIVRDLAALDPAAWCEATKRRGPGWECTLCEAWAPRDSREDWQAPAMRADEHTAECPWRRSVDAMSAAGRLLTK